MKILTIAPRLSNAFLVMLMTVFVVTGAASCGKKSGKAKRKPKKSTPASSRSAGEENRAEEITEEGAEVVQVVATVGDRKIDMVQYDHEMRRQTRHSRSDEAEDRLSSLVLKLLIEKELISLAAETGGLSVNDEEIDEEIRAATERQGGSEAHRTFLQSQGWTPEGYRVEVKNVILRRKVREQRYPVKVTDEDVAQYYEKYAAAGNKGERVRLARVLLLVNRNAAESDWLAAEDRLRAIKLEIDQGLPFADAAKKYSEGAFAKAGGNMGLAGRRRRPAEQFARGFEMEVGAVEGPFRTKDGVRLIKLLEKFEENVGTLEEEKDKIRKVLETKSRQEFNRKLIKDLKREFPVRKLL